jgi:ATP-dependent Lon protease
MSTLIKQYCRESGVRNLQKQIEKVRNLQKQVEKVRNLQKQVEKVNFCLSVQNE